MQNEDRKLEEKWDGGAGGEEREGTPALVSISFNVRSSACAWVYLYVHGCVQKHEALTCEIKASLARRA